MKNNYSKTGFSVVEVILLLVVVVMIGFGAWSIWNQSQPNEPETPEATQNTEDAEKGTYTASSINLTFEYPKDWSIEELPPNPDYAFGQYDDVYVVAPSGFKLRFTASFAQLGGVCETEPTLQTIKQADSSISTVADSDVNVLSYEYADRQHLYLVSEGRLEPDVTTNECPIYAYVIPVFDPQPVGTVQSTPTSISLGASWTADDAPTDSEFNQAVKILGSATLTR